MGPPGWSQEVAPQLVQQNPSLWSETDNCPAPKISANLPHRHECPVLTSSLPLDGDSRADPGAHAGTDQQPGAQLSRQGLSLQGPSCKGLG